MERHIYDPKQLFDYLKAHGVANICGCDSAGNLHFTHGATDEERELATALIAQYETLMNVEDSLPDIMELRDMVDEVQKQVNMIIETLERK
jgi:hypothetical protein